MLYWGVTSTWGVTGRQVRQIDPQELQDRVAETGHQQVVGKAAGVQLLHRSGVNGECAGQLGFPFSPFHDGAAHSGLGQVTCEQQPRWTSTDDQHVSVGSHVLPSAFHRTSSNDRDHLAAARHRW